MVFFVLNSCLFYQVFIDFYEALEFTIGFEEVYGLFNIALDLPILLLLARLGGNCLFHGFEQMSLMLLFLFSLLF
jgi:hypothetical protein